MDSDKDDVQKLAREFFLQEWGDPRISIHSECVIDICNSACINTDLDRRIFVIAGWIHDLGRKIDKDMHHELSVNSFHSFLKAHPEFTEISEEIEDCILNHRSEGQPKTVYGLVFKAADKAAKHHKKWLSFKSNSK